MTSTDPVPTPSAADTPLDDGLRGRVSSGLRWSLFNNVVARVVTVGSGIVMARILVPEDFGVYAVALLVINVLFGLNDLGLLLAVVRWPGDLLTAARTAMTLAGGFSVVVYGLVFVTAAPFADFMGAPEATNVLRVLALVIVVDGLTTAPHGLLIRDFAQDKLAKAELTAMPVGVAVSISLAVAGAGPWALAGGFLAANLVTAVQVYRLAPLRVLPGFDATAARWMLAYGGPLALTSVVEYLLLNADYLIVGRVLGTVALGFYLLAYNVSNWPVAIISDAVRRVSIAGFARIEQEDERLRAGFRATFRLMVAVALPLVVLLSLLSAQLIQVLYGSKWSDAAEILTFLAVLGGVRVAVGYVFDLLVGIGRTRLTLVLKLVWFTVLVPSLLWAAGTGEVARVAMVHAVVALLVAAPLFLLATRTIGVGGAMLVRDNARAVLAAAVATAAGYGVLQLLEGPWVQLVVTSGVVVVVYVVLAVPGRVLAERTAALRRRGTPA